MCEDEYEQTLYYGSIVGLTADKQRVKKMAQIGFVRSKPKRKANGNRVGNRGRKRGSDVAGTTPSARKAKTASGRGSRK